MKTVRLCTFETNSSSTHAICMCTAADYEKFKNMELFLHWETLQTAEELYEEFISIYTDFPLNLGENNGGETYTTPDRITWQGKTWRVVKVRDWSAFNYYQCLAVRVTD